MNPASPKPSLWPLLVVLGAASVAAFEWLLPPTGNPTKPTTGAPAVAVSAVAPTTLECPALQLPDDGVCVPVPPPEDTAPATATPIELLPGRTPDYTRYVTPIAAYPARVAAQGLGLFVPAPRGVPVTAISLEGQFGATRRWVTPTSPPRLLTVHRVERAGATRTYVLLYTGLTFDAGAPGLTDIDVGTPLGRITARPGLSGLSLAVRQARRGVDVESLSPERLLLDSSSLECDPRNVLPLLPAP